LIGESEKKKERKKERKKQKLEANKIDTYVGTYINLNNKQTTNSLCTSKNPPD